MSLGCKPSWECVCARLPAWVTAVVRAGLGLTLTLTLTLTGTLTLTVACQLHAWAFQRSWWTSNSVT